MVSSYHCLTSIINVESLVSLVVIGQRTGATEAACRTSGGAERVSEGAGRTSERGGKVSEGAEWARGAGWPSARRWSQEGLGQN